MAPVETEYYDLVCRYVPPELKLESLYFLWILARCPYGRERCRSQEGVSETGYQDQYSFPCSYPLVLTLQMVISVSLPILHFLSGSVVSVVPSRQEPIS